MNQNTREGLGVLGVFISGILIVCAIGFFLYNKPADKFEGCRMVLKEETGFTRTCGKACVRKTHVYKYICPDAVKYEIK